jgi:hypothetical protein
MRIKGGYEGIVAGVLMLAIALVLIVGLKLLIGLGRRHASANGRLTMTKVGRFVTDPRAGAYCQVTLDSGEKILVNHDRGETARGSLVIEQIRWWGLAVGDTLLR